MRLLCVTAHPDDEAGGFGGSLLLSRARAVETYVLCLTPGQAATHRGGHQADQELAAARRQEFACACEILQVTRGEVLDYPDAGLQRVDPLQAVGELVRRMRQIRPQVVITFGPEGGVTGHIDHSMASLFATMAYHWAGRGNRYPEQFTDGLQPHRAQKLYYGTATFALPDRQPISLPARHGHHRCRTFSGNQDTRLQGSSHPIAALPDLRKDGARAGRITRCSIWRPACIPAPLATETDLFAGVAED